MINRDRMANEGKYGFGGLIIEKYSSFLVADSLILPYELRLGK